MAPSQEHPNSWVAAHRPWHGGQTTAGADDAPIAIRSRADAALEQIERRLAGGGRDHLQADALPVRYFRLLPDWLLRRPSDLCVIADATCLSQDQQCVLSERLRGRAPAHRDLIAIPLVSRREI
jgi:hypothetical protein